jgi:hypothetical protein
MVHAVLPKGSIAGGAGDEQALLSFDDILAVDYQLFDGLVSMGMHDGWT